MGGSADLFRNGLLRINVSGFDLAFLGFGKVQVAGCCECGDELSGLIKCAEVLSCLNHYRLLKNKSTLWLT